MPGNLIEVTASAYEFPLLIKQSGFVSVRQPKRAASPLSVSLPTSGTTPSV